MPRTEPVIGPGGVVGILGDGQLGRMLALAAAQLGFRTAVLGPNASGPAHQVATYRLEAAYDDAAALDRLAEMADVVTYEFENVPAASAERLAASVVLRPNARALTVSQDRVVEKTFLRDDAGVEVTPFEAVEGADQIAAALTRIGPDAFLKTRRFGYDGKGQARVPTALEAPAAWAAIGAHPAILEAAAPFVREISVIVARGADGAVAAYDPGENLHEAGILRRTQVPGDIAADTAADARAIGRRIADALDYVGVLGVEMFALEDGRLLVNEIAPRVHNTGHWTQGACVVDQFEQHVRAICGWPLGDVRRLADATMTNLLGAEVDDWAAAAARPGVAVHLYGKAESRAGRKMGHVIELRPRG